MRRTKQLQGLRLMKFDEVYGRTYRGELSQLEAAEILGMSERTFRRWRDRFEAEGAEGLYDRRLGRVSARRAGVDEVVALLDLFDTRYRIASDVSPNSERRVPPRTICVRGRQFRCVGPDRYSSRSPFGAVAGRNRRPRQQKPPTGTGRGFLPPTF